MNTPADMDLKKIVKTSIFIILSISIIYFLTTIRRQRTEKLTETEITSGKDLVYRVYNSSNKLSVEIKCSSSKKDYDEARSAQHRDRMYLNDIKGTIYKKGKITTDTAFYSESGYVENNFQNLFLSGGKNKSAKIESDDLLIESDHLFMEGNSLISSDSKVEFWLKDLDGTAEKGIEYHIKIDVLNLFRASGTFVKSSRKYDFDSKKLIVLGKLNLVVFRGKPLIEGPASKLKGREISMQFTEDFKKIRNTIIKGNGYVHLNGENPGDYREAFGKKIRASFADSGAVESLEIRGNGILNLKKGKDKVRIEANLIFIKFDPQTSYVRFVRTLRGSKLNVTGKERFSLNANRIKVQYDKKGEIKSSSGMINCLFKFRNYSGSAKKIEYTSATGVVLISGERSIIEKSGSRFVSTRFTLDTKQNKLRSDDKIVSSISIKSDNPVFTSKSVFLSSKKVEIDEKRGEIRYLGDVTLVQDDTLVKSDLFILPKKGGIILSGKVNLKFKSDNDLVTVKGGKILFSDDGGRFDIKNGGSFSFDDGKLRSDTLSISFTEKKQLSLLKGFGSTKFSREDLKGNSDEILWDIEKNKIRFYGNAKISKSGSGTTSGEIIEYFIEKERIRVLSKKRSRTKTNIK